MWVRLCTAVLSVGLLNAVAFGANIGGSVRLNGPVPQTKSIPMKSDPYCVRVNQGQSVTPDADAVGPSGELPHVFVEVISGRPKTSQTPPAAPVLLNQIKCRFEPHVVGVQMGQVLRMTSDDQTLHNLHAFADVGQHFNKAMPQAGHVIEHVFSRPERVKVGCDVHRWMRAWVHVVDHPYFAVSNAQGEFTLPDLPAGRYTLRAWHEVFGELEQSVVVGAKNPSARVAFTFKSQGESP